MTREQFEKEGLIILESQNVVKLSADRLNQMHCFGVFFRIEKVPRTNSNGAEGRREGTLESRAEKVC